MVHVDSLCHGLSTCLCLQVPWCAVDITNCSAPAAVWGTYTDAGSGKNISIDLCLPKRDRTISGCLCASEWFHERIEPLIGWTNTKTAATKYELDSTVHGPYYAVCNATANGPGGPQCVVAPGSCTVLPQKTSLLTPLLSTPDGNTSHSISLSSASSIIAFWPIFEQCGDPFNDAGRNILKDIAYDAVLALEHKGLNFDTQAHCRCSPEYWSYYGAPGAAAIPNIGCSNPNNDPLGPWCPVDPRSCPSYYSSFAQPAQAMIPAGYTYTYGFMDYCGPVRKITQSG
eukprot:jgi/Chrzof1/5085/Cz15g10350.t1